MDLVPSTASSSTRVSLGTMSQQALVREPEDDWTGTADRERRRRLQNRLNQRAYSNLNLLLPLYWLDWLTLGNTRVTQASWEEQPPNSQD